MDPITAIYLGYGLVRGAVRGADDLLKTLETASSLPGRVKNLYSHVSATSFGDAARQRIIQSRPSDLIKLSPNTVVNNALVEMQNLRQHQVLNEPAKLQQLFQPLTKVSADYMFSSQVTSVPPGSATHNPWKVLHDPRPLSMASGPPSADHVAVIFEHDGMPFVGWQLRDVLPQLFGIDASSPPRTLAAPSGGGGVEASKIIPNPAGPNLGASGRYSMTPKLDGLDIKIKASSATAAGEVSHALAGTSAHISRLPQGACVEQSLRQKLADAGLKIVLREKLPQGAWLGFTLGTDPMYILWGYTFLFTEQEVYVRYAGIVFGGGYNDVLRTFSLDEFRRFSIKHHLFGGISLKFPKSESLRLMQLSSAKEDARFLKILSEVLR